MVDNTENCAHLRGLQIASGLGYWCPSCEEVLDVVDVAAWVREAERARDEVHLMVEGGEFAEIAREESQQEVYRRRKLLYELQEIPRTATKPEMLLVVYDLSIGCYECRAFYKEPKPMWCTEHLSVEATEEKIQDLRSHSDPVVRVVAEKVLGFHEGRKATPEWGIMPTRRVFYSNEL